MCFDLAAHEDTEISLYLFLFPQVIYHPRNLFMIYVSLQENVQYIQHPPLFLIKPLIISKYQQF